MYRSILVPTDGSEFCQRAIEHAVKLAKQTGARIIGLTVTFPLHTGTPHMMFPGELRAVLHEQTVKEAAEKLAVIEAAAKAAGVPCETVRKAHDHPWEAIIQEAEGKGCDLIVMASHGRRGVSGVVLGSETQKVLTHSKVPVLVVR
jgi:nucleotide-binding universal stress UspA family protein